MNKAPSAHPISVYIATVIVLFFCMLSAADSIGFVPDYIDGSTPLTTGGSTPSDITEPDAETSSAADTISLSSLPQLGVTAPSAPAAAATTPVPITPLPTRIQIPAIDLDLPVQNPTTLDVNALDTLLQKGPARYADSSKLGEDGTLIIFGHSSHLPVVHNQMFRAFNKLPDLKAGDTIALTGANGTSYLYSVTSVRKADASEKLSLQNDGKHLTIVTCDTLTGKSARFVLDASFIGTAE